MEFAADRDVYRMQGGFGAESTGSSYGTEVACPTYAQVQPER